MSTLTDSELKDMVRIAEETFNDECTIRQWTGRAQDEYGGVTDTFTEIEHVSCGFTSPGARVFEREVDQAVVLQADALLRVSLDQPLSVNDVILVRDKTYQVDGVHDGMTVRLATLKSMETSE